MQYEALRFSQHFDRVESGYPHGRYRCGAYRDNCEYADNAGYAKRVKRRDLEKKRTRDVSHTDAGHYS